ncbi:hypothetical protein OnM2_023001b [Erysiphe neolycopersici]|uniref:Uncharacterized protein n=1 Tax=Erysiphe neolycopersici TaxID=212602 RepID=A0A420I1Z5_9PEZI|nr:hypothetical protein OnM2_023001b [Erysiphe neolycopersici]
MKNLINIGGISRTHHIIRPLQNLPLALPESSRTPGAHYPELEEYNIEKEKEKKENDEQESLDLKSLLQKRAHQQPLMTNYFKEQISSQEKDRSYQKRNAPAASQKIEDSRGIHQDRQSLSSIQLFSQKIQHIPHFPEVQKLNDSSEGDRPLWQHDISNRLRW